MSVDSAIFAGSPLFASLEKQELEAIVEQGRPRTFEPGEALCRSGEACESCWLITAGLVDVLGPSGESEAAEVIGRLRKGAVVGDVAVVLGEPYSETVVASIPTATLELGAAQLSELVQRAPRALLGVVRTLHGRLAHAHARSVQGQQGESVALVVGASLRRAVPGLLSAAQSASPFPVTSLDRQFSFAGAVTAADDLISSHRTVLLPVELDAETVGALRRESDRVVAVAGTAGETAELGVLDRGAGAGTDIEVVLVGQDAIRASGAWSTDAPLRVVHRCEPERGMKLSDADVAWLARHLTRTKIGLALGAGGARGYAHVGVLQVLEEAGYIVDCVAGSSIGAVVGTQLALGAQAAEIEHTLREMFDAGERRRALQDLALRALQRAGADDPAAAGDDRREDIRRHGDPVDGHGRRSDRAGSSSAKGRIFMGRPARRYRARGRLSATRASGPSPRRRPGAGSRPHRCGARSGCGHHRIREPAEREDAPQMAGRTTAGAARRAPAARRARRPARGDGPQPAVRERAPRGAGRRADHAAVRARTNGATSISPISSWPRGARPPRSGFQSCVRWPCRRTVQTKPREKEEALPEQTQFGFEDLKRILVDRVGLAEADVKDDPNTTFDEMGLDSLAFVEIQLAMEQEYDINVSDEDAERIHTVGESIAYVNEQLAEKV